MTRANGRRLLERLRAVARRDLLAIALPLLVFVALGFWAAAQFVKPAPPDKLMVTTGAEGGAYQYYAARYKPILARYGIEMVERPSAGAIENLTRLLDGKQAVDAGFIQGGIGRQVGTGTLESLGGLYYEPLWVFYRGKPGVGLLQQLAGKRLAVGPEGSGTRRLALDLLEAHGMAEGTTQVVALGGLAAADALRRGEVDAVFAVGAAQSGTVWSLLYSEGISLLSFDLADAYTRRFSNLSKLVLPRGAIDLVRNIPPRDVTLVASVASLVVREDTHPALIDLLLQAAVEVHNEHGLFQRAGEFPSARHEDFPLNQRAGRFYKSGAPFLQRYLPFWVANFIDRILVMLVPVIALLIPLARIAPQLYSWRVRSRIYRWYGELKFLEIEAEANLASRTREQWLAAVDRIERAANRIPTPLAFADHVYNLRTHIALVRQRLRSRLRAAAELAASGAGSTEPE